MTYQFIGVDIGGSHITAALVNIQEGVVEEHTLVRAKVDPHQDADTILMAWSTAIQTVADIAGLRTYQLGIAMPGPFDYTAGISLMKNVNKYEHLYGINIRKELAERLGIEQICIHFRNDAEAFLEGEMLFGAGKSFGTGIGLTLGTGLGTSKFNQGLTTDMALGINHPMHEGVAEDYISTRWFIGRYQELTQQSVQGVKPLVELYQEDRNAQQVFQEFSENISLFVSEVIELFQPEVIVFGGNIAQASSLFFEAIEAKIKHCNPPILLKKSILNENAALMGAVGFGVSMSPVQE
ncbi:MAG: ROK family protein [Spirosomataceae bacterium]